MAKPSRDERQQRRALEQLTKALERRNANDAVEAWLELAPAPRAAHAAAVRALAHAALAAAQREGAHGRLSYWAARDARAPELFDAAEGEPVETGYDHRWALLWGCGLHRDWPRTEALWAALRDTTSARAPALAAALDAWVQTRRAPSPTLLAALEPSLSTQPATSDDARLGRELVRPRGPAAPAPATRGEAEGAVLRAFASAPLEPFVQTLRAWLRDASADVGRAVFATAAPLLLREALRPYARGAHEATTDSAAHRTARALCELGEAVRASDEPHPPALEQLFRWVFGAERPPWGTDLLPRAAATLARWPSGERLVTEALERFPDARALSKPPLDELVRRALVRAPSARLVLLCMSGVDDVDHDRWLDEYDASASEHLYGRLDAALRGLAATRRSALLDGLCTVEVEHFDHCLGWCAAVLDSDGTAQLCADLLADPRCDETRGVRVVQQLTSLLEDTIEEASDEAIHTELDLLSDHLRIPVEVLRLLCGSIGVGLSVDDALRDFFTKTPTLRLFAWNSSQVFDGKLRSFLKRYEKLVFRALERHRAALRRVAPRIVALDPSRFAWMLSIAGDAQERNAVVRAGFADRSVAQRHVEQLTVLDRYGDRAALRGAVRTLMSAARDPLGAAIALLDKLGLINTSYGVEEAIADEALGAYAALQRQGLSLAAEQQVALRMVQRRFPHLAKEHRLTTKSTATKPRAKKPAQGASNKPRKDTSKPAAKRTSTTKRAVKPLASATSAPSAEAAAEPTKPTGTKGSKRASSPKPAAAPTSTSTEDATKPADAPPERRTLRGRKPSTK